MTKAQMTKEYQMPKYVHSIVLLIAFCLDAVGSNVLVIRTPEGGIQPQVTVDLAGTAHLVFYKGKDGAGDVFYATQKAKEKEFSKAIKVNSRPGSAIAAGTIRGAQLAVGKNNRVHVVWNGGAGSEERRVGKGGGGG